jgi:hypothetical protein
MIEIQQGTPGSGKSAVAVARAITHLRKGGVVAANFSLVDGWASQVVKRSVLSHLPFGWGEEYAFNKASDLHKRFFRVDSLDAIRSINPRELATGLYKDDGTYSEGNGLLILDEAQLIFNSRKWEKNLPWIEFFTQHRKLGWNIVLIAHHQDMIDSQIRPLCEYESRFRNLQKVHWPVIGAPLVPFPLFIVIKRYSGLGAGASAVAGRDLFPLPLWAARLYDSLEVFAFRQDNEVSNLPRLCGPPPAPPCGVGGGDSYRFRSAAALDCLWSRWDALEVTAEQRTTVRGGQPASYQ